MKTTELIYTQQKEWADKRGIELHLYSNKPYARCLSGNLYCQPSSETVHEFEIGKGNEIRSGKMRALHSSSALVLNIFEYWRQSNHIDEIARACGAPFGTTTMQFERTYPILVGGTPPHLDVELSGERLNSVLAIESKFTEPYQRHTKRTIKEKYFTAPSLWAELPSRCRELAVRIHEEEQGKTSFAYLDAPQLLKHLLGLSLTTKASNKAFELLYLWYEVPSSPEAKKHRLELEQFKQCLGDEVRLRDMTYQDLFEAIRKCPNASKDYLDYLGQRYFPSQTLPIHST